MKYCVRCLYPENHPLHLTFDDEGVCSGCRVHEEKDSLDWRERTERLRALTGRYRAKTRAFDCVVPVTGARDSYFIVHVVKNVLGMRPLLVNYNQHYNTKAGIRNLAYLRTLFGCDLVQETLSPTLVKRVTRASLRLRGSMYWHCLAGRTVFPVHVAVKHKIPLVIWGAHQGTDQVGMFSHLDEVEMTRKYRKEHDLLGVEAEDLVGGSEALTLEDMEPFVYPHDKELESVGVRGIYLNNYVRWDSKAQHELMIRDYGYETQEQQRTFDTYNDVDCFHYSGLHDAIKMRKWGYSKVTDHATREIRLRRMTRAEGIALVEAHEQVEPRDVDLFCRWLGVSPDELWSDVDRFRDPRAWMRAEDGSWRRRDTVARHLGDPGVEAARLTPREASCSFRLTGPKAPGSVEDAYVLIGRGFVDGVMPKPPVQPSDAAG